MLLSNSGSPAAEMADGEETIEAVSVQLILVHGIGNDSKEYLSFGLTSHTGPGVTEHADICCMPCALWVHPHT